MKLEVLIIEDESIVALHMKKSLVTLGHEVIAVVKNGADALEVCSKKRVDLVVSDINIQADIDGIECCAILQSKYRLAVIFVTAYRDIETLKKASMVEFIGYLVKPFREDELETMINLAILKNDVFNQQGSMRINDEFFYCYTTDELFMNHEVVPLTHKEKQFLLELLKAKGCVVPYQILEQSVWDGVTTDDNARRQLVHRFRQKAPNFPFTLVKKVGYKVDL